MKNLTAKSIIIVTLFSLFITISCQNENDTRVDFTHVQNIEMQEMRTNEEINDGVQENEFFLTSTVLRIVSKLVLDFLDMRGLTIERINTLLNLFRQENINYLMDLFQRTIKLGVQAGTLAIKYFPTENPLDAFINHLKNLKSRVAFYNVVDNKRNQTGPYLPERLVKIVDYVTQRTLETTTTEKKGFDSYGLPAKVQEVDGNHQDQDYVEFGEFEDDFANLPHFDKKNEFKENHGTVNESLKFIDDSKLETSQYGSIDKIPLQQIPVLLNNNDVDSYGVPVRN